MLDFLTSEFEKVIFANGSYVYVFLIIPILILLYVFGTYAKQHALNKFGDTTILMPLMDETSRHRPFWKFFILLFAGLFLSIVLLRPQFGSQLKEIKRQGVEIVIALDVSNSMLAEDIRPNRLENAKLAISKLIEKLKDDKIGLIVFAGDAYTQIPITTDYSATDMFLYSINTGIVPKQGTAIGAAIELGMRSFSPENDKSKVLIIITDGENHEDNAVEAARTASENNIIVHTIGMGLAEGTPIPKSNGSNDFRRDRNGNVIISKLDITMLQQIAQAGKGMFVQATNTSSALNTLFKEINRMETQEMETKIFSDYEEKFQYMAGIALFLLLLDFLILERKNRMLKNVKIFESKF